MREESTTLPVVDYPIEKMNRFKKENVQFNPFPGTAIRMAIGARDGNSIGANQLHQRKEITAHLLIVR